MYKPVLFSPKLKNQMRKNIFVLAFILFASSNISFGQLYERVYAESNQLVQNKMNDNKMNGLELLSGITTKHTVSLSGLSVSQKTEFETLLNAQSDVISHDISSDLNTLTIDSKATFSKEMLMQMIENFQLTLISYSAEYSVQQ